MMKKGQNFSVHSASMRNDFFFTSEGVRTCPLDLPGLIYGRLAEGTRSNPELYI